MKTKNIYKENCNIFIPRNIISLSLILSKKKNYNQDDYILINNNRNFSNGFSNDIINFLKKEKFKIILNNKKYNFKEFKSSKNLFIQKYFKINFFKNLNYITKSILKTKYVEFNNINLKNYKAVNIYYSSSMTYYYKIYTKFKNINLFFLEHGVGSFLSFITDEDNYHQSFKRKLESFLKILIFKTKGISFPDRSYYYGICGKMFNKKKLNYDNHKTSFINLENKNGFNLLFKFYKKYLTNLKKNTKMNYIYLEVDSIYTKNSFKNYIKFIIQNIKYKKNNIFLIKQKKNSLNSNNSDYCNTLKEILKKDKINFFFLKPTYTHIPVEMILKFFKVKEIYTPQSSIAYTSSYFLNNDIKINLICSKNMKKKFESYKELKPNAFNFIKKNYIYKNINIINID